MTDRYSFRLCFPALWLAVALCGCSSPKIDPLADDNQRPIPCLPNRLPPVRSVGARPSLAFELNSRRLLAGGVLVWMNDPAIKRGKEWHVSAADRALILAPLLHPESVLSTASESPIVLDAGHGGIDSGAVGRRGLEEKTLVLDIARRTARELEKAGHKVRLTRDRDAGLTLAERARAAARWNAGLLVSIHLNFARNSAAAGIETFVLTPPNYPSTAGSGTIPETAYPANQYDAASMALAFPIHRRLLAVDRHTDRGIKRARFDIIRNAPCPAVLVECGFLSSASDEARLADSFHRAKLASAIADGIQEYIDQVQAAKKPAHPVPLIR